MTSSSDLFQTLKNGIRVDASSPLGGWEDVYITPGHTHECHPDFVATPLGPSPYGFLVCQRKPTPPPSKPVRGDKYYQTYQTYDLYSNRANVEPRRTYLGGQPRSLQDRRPPNEAYLQSKDYYKDSLRFRAIGIENVDKIPGEYGYEENKYFYSGAPAYFDITQPVQPYDLWRREQLRNGHISAEGLEQFEKDHNYNILSSTF